MATTLEALVGRLGDDTLVALDPNCRPTMIDGPRRLPRAAAAACSPAPTCVKASEDDLAWLDPGARPGRRGPRLLAAGRAVALVTLGGEGALVVTADDVRRGPRAARSRSSTRSAPATRSWAPSSPTGAPRAGPRRTSRRLDEVERGRAFACRVAAITCSRAGADPPRLAEL